MSGDPVQGKVSSPCVVYSTVQEMQSVDRGTVKPIPAYDLYKTAREEELSVYRGVCRVLAMHRTGVDLPKPMKRLLEDLQEELCIPAERAQLEWETATADEVVLGISRSGVLRRREDFFDGVEDVPIEKAILHAKDDGQTMMVPAKMMKTEAMQAGVHSGASGNPPGRRKATHSAAQATINTIKKDVVKAARELLYNKEVNAAEKKKFLEEKKQELLQLRKELTTE